MKTALNLHIYNFYHTTIIVFLWVKTTLYFFHRILQLEAASSQLNSNDAFILVTPGGSTLWVGVGASDTEKRGARQLCDILGVSASELSEGGETGEERERQPKPVVNCGHIWLKQLVVFHNQDVGPSVLGCLNEGAAIASAFQMSVVISRFNLKTPPPLPPQKRILCPQFKQESSG